MSTESRVVSACMGVTALFWIAGAAAADDAASAQPVTAHSTDADRYRALEPGTQGSDAIARVLSDFHGRHDGEGGFAWWMRLPIAVRSRQGNDTEARHWRNRIEFLRDAQRKDAVSCAVSGQPVLADTRLGCDYVVELERYLDCTAPLPEARHAALMTALRASAMTRLGTDADRCPQAAARISVLRETLAGG